jgi:hypothetical protein
MPLQIPKEEDFDPELKQILKKLEVAQNEKLERLDARREEAIETWREHPIYAHALTEGDVSETFHHDREDEIDTYKAKREQTIRAHYLAKDLKQQLEKGGKQKELDHEGPSHER